MGNIRILPFNPEHIRGAEFREPDARAVQDFANLEEYLLVHTSSGESYSIFVDSVWACAGGVVMLREGVGEAWALTTPLVSEYRISIARCAIKYLGGMIERLNLHRVQASIQETHKDSIKFMEYMGFEFEGTLRKYGTNQENYVLYARVM